MLFLFSCCVVARGKDLYVLPVNGRDVVPNHVWIGANPIWVNMNRVALPRKVFELDVADTEAPLFWAYDTEEDLVVISRLRDEFTENDRFTHLGDVKVHANREVAVPQEVMEEYTGFDFGDPLHFVTTPELTEKKMCMVVPESVARDRFDGFDDLSGEE